MILTKYNLQFYYDWKLEKHSSNYNVIIDQTLVGSIDVNRLAVALKNFVNEHLIINSHIALNSNGEPYWKPNQAINHLNYYPDINAQEGIYDFSATSFDLEHEALYRFGLFKIAKNRYRLILVFHHVIIDIISLKDISALIASYYNDPDYHEPLLLSEQESIYKNYLQSSNAAIENFRSNYEAFWLNKIEGYEGINLDCFKYSATGMSPQYQGGIKEYRFNIDSIEQIREVARIFGLTPYFFTMSIFAIMIYRYTSQKCFVVGYPLSIKGIRNLMVGVNVNLSVIPFQFHDEITIGELLERCQQFVTSLKSDTDIASYANYPFKDMTELLGNSKLVTLLFGRTLLDFSPIKFNDVDVIKLNSNPNLNYSGKMVIEQEHCDDSFNFRIRYDSAVFNSTIIKDFANQYVRLANLVISDLIVGYNKPIASYQLLNSSLSLQSSIIGNNIREDIITSDICELFEKQVLATPDKQAVISEYRGYTYNELNQFANKIAHLLLNHYLIKPDTLILIMLAPSPLMIATIIGVLKAGGAYLPIDPEYPIDYLNIIDLAKPIAILSEESFYNKLARLDLQISIKFVDTRTFVREIESLPADISPLRLVSNRNLAYVLYTSGTTGKPKGIMVEHSAVVNFVKQNSYLELNSDSVILQSSNYACDASVFEIFGALLNGGTLVSLDKATLLDSNKLAVVIKEERVNTVFLTTKLFLTYIGLGENNPFLDVKNILFGGEKASYSVVAKFANEYPDINLIHCYGPTETTVFATTWKVDRSYNGLPIGKPIADKICYVLDDNLNPVPVGAIGTLYIGGYGLARGYLNNYELSSERFIINPFSSGRLASQYLYKTGDLVRYLPDGNIEYISRIDSQIKVNGFLVNLESIEIIVNNYPGILNSLAVYQDEILVLYYDSVEPIENNVLITYLASKLPEYMLPKFIMHYKFELNANGKIYRNKLPKFEMITNDISKPSNDIERDICQAFSEVLNIDIAKVGVNNSYTSLGGNSLKVILLVNHLARKYSISASDIFKYQTPNKLAQLIIQNQ